MLGHVKRGYTNRTAYHDGVVRKTYDGPDARARQTSELRALEALHDRLPVPAVTATGTGWIETEFVTGNHGQDLIDAGRAPSVLAECGRVLRRLHRLDPRLLEPAVASDLVIQHGDFGPNNLLFDLNDGHAVAVLDWEFSSIGQPITDIAWCEWIVRMHHPDSVSALPAFFESYGECPPSQQRKEEMMRRCRWLERFATRWEPTGPAGPLWRQRAETVQGWTE
ncbi:phosphotransferase family protein [Flexivirga caeni]|uniref:Aminoglycoside phosphotransferase n=1 Tax=Flexivirga caeni TaxID=2294115 RepID=A0A3M9MI46_9MICO|nr:phosphotransferase [Flexivirga caeni]RNI25250.1 aminoglycoside phosphotransferase [Flexivirga caeni]